MFLVIIEPTTKYGSGKGGLELFDDITVGMILVRRRPASILRLDMWDPVFQRDLFPGARFSVGRTKRPSWTS